MSAKRSVVLAPSATLLAATMASAADESHGALTRDDAVGDYLAALAAGDGEVLPAVSAIDEMAEGYRVDLMIERPGVFMPVSEPAPAHDELLVETNRAQAT